MPKTKLKTARRARRQKRMTLHIDIRTEEILRKVAMRNGATLQQTIRNAIAYAVERCPEIYADAS